VVHMDPIDCIAGSLFPYYMAETVARPHMVTQGYCECIACGTSRGLHLRTCAMQNRRSHTYPVMKSYREELWFEIGTRRAFINITPQVEAVLRKSRVREGLLLVNAMHITASVYINDDEPGLLKDYEEFLERLVPQQANYLHNRTGEDNGDAHIKRQIMGREVIVAVTNGTLDFGPWEQIFYGEFDGRRRKRVLVKIIGE
jgi:secondary thiamine-phosphate synthase enzyme